MHVVINPDGSRSIQPNQEEFTIDNPERVKLVLPGEGWEAFQFLKESSVELLTFVRDSGKVSITVSATTQQALKTETIKDFDPSDPDSTKLLKLLQWSSSGWTTGSNDSSGIPKGELKTVANSAKRGQICSSDSTKSRCSFIIHTTRDNWIIADVLVSTKETTAEELGKKFLARVKNDELSDYEKHGTRGFKSIGLGMSIWYNWEDDQLNPDRDFSRAILLRRAGILDFGGSFALDYATLYGFNPGDSWRDWGWRFMALVGFRIYLINAFVSPFVGAQFGLGMQYDDHYSKFRDKFAINIAGSLDAGLVFCRYCSYQFELGASYDAVEDGFFNDQTFGSFNFYGAINY